MSTTRSLPWRGAQRVLGQSTRGVPTRYRRGSGGVLWGTNVEPTRYQRGTNAEFSRVPAGVLRGTGGVPRGYGVLQGGLGIGQGYPRVYSRGIRGYSRGTLGGLYGYSKGTLGDSTGTLRVLYGYSRALSVKCHAMLRALEGHSPAAQWRARRDTQRRTQVYSEGTQLLLTGVLMGPLRLWDVLWTTHGSTRTRAAELSAVLRKRCHSA